MTRDIRASGLGDGTRTNVFHEDAAGDVSYVGTHGEERLVLADNYFNKTRHNVRLGGQGALLFRDKTGKAYQIKGTLEYHTEGDVYDSMKKWNPPKHPGHAALAIRVEEVFSGAERLL